MAGTVTMDARERNKQIVREILDEIGRGNLEKFRSAMANDIRYSIAGSSPFSGAHTREQWWNEVVKPLGEKLDGHIGIELKTIIAEGDLVFSQSQGAAKTKDGRPYNHLYAHLWRFKDGKIIEITEWLDTALTSQIFGKR
jgi:ketosteroid isomerase-like protein